MREHLKYLMICFGDLCFNGRWNSGQDTEEKTLLQERTCFLKAGQKHCRKCCVGTGGLMGYAKVEGGRL